MAITHHFERPVTAVHQVELTSRCNLRCTYCTSPQIMKGQYPNRPALDMTEDTFKQALEWVKHFVKKGTQSQELNLAGIGESTLHPQFIEFAKLARDAIGPKRTIIFATNGILLTDEIASELAKLQPVSCWVSLHRPEKAMFAVDIARKHGIFGGVSTDPATHANDWAGQVKWKKAEYTMPCTWLMHGRVFITADGNVTACCLDAKGSGVLATVWDDPATAITKTYDLCPNCHHTLPLGLAGGTSKKLPTVS